MVTINGNFFEPNTSARYPACLEFQDDQYTLMVAGTSSRAGVSSEITLSPRVGNIHGRLQWADGALFETPENDKLDASGLGRNRHGSRFLHRLEANWCAAIGSVVVAIVVAFSMFRWGIPAASRHIAMSLPVSAHEMVSTGTMKTLDKFIFSPTNLNDKTQDRVSRSFDKLVAQIDSSEFEYRLYFKSMRGIANAMALPSGEIIVTDAFVKMADSGELEAVLLHELGHVVERHGMTRVISASAVSGIVSMVFGDMSGLNELVVGMPIFLVHSSYSRNNESAADAYAFEQMIEAGIDPIHFASIIKKITGEHDSNSEDLETDEYRRYLSSHPITVARANSAEQASRRFKLLQSESGK